MKFVINLVKKSSIFRQKMVTKFLLGGEQLIRQAFFCSTVKKCTIRRGKKIIGVFWGLYLGGKDIPTRLGLCAAGDRRIASCPCDKSENGLP